MAGNTASATFLQLDLCPEHLQTENILVYFAFGGTALSQVPREWWFLRPQAWWRWRATSVLWAGVLSARPYWKGRAQGEPRCCSALWRDGLQGSLLQTQILLGLLVYSHGRVLESVFSWIRKGILMQIGLNKSGMTDQEERI